LAVGAQSFQYPPRLVDPVPHHQPAGAVGGQEEEDQERRRRKRLHPEHPAPLRWTKRQPGDQKIREEGEEHAENNVELRHRHQPAAVAGGRDFRNVHGRDHRRPADPYASDEAEEKKGMPVPGQGAADRGDEIKNGDADQGVTPADPVGRPARRQRPRNGTDQSGGHGEAEPEGIEIVDFPEPLGGSGDHGRVESEEKAAHGGDDGGLDESRLHVLLLLRMETTDPASEAG
jgi:hypothetical protein